MNRWLALGLLVATAVALGLRCPKLDARPMHNDEGVNAVKFAGLWQHGVYNYDPSEYHGPTLYYASLVLGKLTGAPAYEDFSEGRFRFLNVLFGAGLILLLPGLRDGLGGRAVLIAALFTAVSPAMVFYSRYYIHEMLLVFFALLTLVAGWRYWRTRKLGWMLLAGAGIGLMHSTKETFIISLGCAGLALGINSVWNRSFDASGLPVKAAPVHPLHLVAGLAVWLGIAALLFSSFCTNASGPLDSIRTYSHYLGRAGGDSSHSHGAGFYWHRLLYFHTAKGPAWSEAFILVLALVGAGAGFLRRGLGTMNGSLIRFISIYSLLLAAAYSQIGYKTPWCLLNFWQGMILMAGIGAVVILNAITRPWAEFVAKVVLFLGMIQLGAQAWEASVPYAADQRNPYVYAQTSTDILRLIHRVESLQAVHPDGHRMQVKVMSPENDFWPLPWYLRRFKQVGWWDNVPSDPDAPVMIVASRFGAGLDENKTHLMTGIFQLRPGVFFELYVELKLWEAWLKQHPPQDSEDGAVTPD